MTSDHSHGSPVPATGVAAPPKNPKSPPTSYELLEKQLEFKVDRRSILAVIVDGRIPRGLAGQRALAAARSLGFEPGELGT